MVFKFRSRNTTGFRINAEPLPWQKSPNIHHRYQVSIIGVGNPICVNILDSAFNIAYQKMVPRCEDNSSRFNELDVIGKAQTLNIPIFTIGITLEQSAEQSLKNIAIATGGQYFPPNSPIELDSAFHKIKGNII